MYFHDNQIIEIVVDYFSSDQLIDESINPCSSTWKKNTAPPTQAHHLITILQCSSGGGERKEENSRSALLVSVVLDAHGCRSSFCVRVWLRSCQCIMQNSPSAFRTVAGLGKDGDPYEPHAPSTASSKRVSPGCCNHPPFPNPILRIHFPFSTFSSSLSQSSSCQSTARSRYRERRSCVWALIEGFPLIKAWGGVSSTNG